MNPVELFMWTNERTLKWETLVTGCVTGFPVDCIHAAATVFFLWTGAESILEKLDRIKLKYGLME